MYTYGACDLARRNLEQLSCERMLSDLTRQHRGRRVSEHQIYFRGTRTKKIPTPTNSSLTVRSFVVDHTRAIEFLERGLLLCLTSRREIFADVSDVRRRAAR